MNIAEFTIQKKTIALVMTGVLIVGGLLAYESLPRLEDPEFTIKNALIITPYPGANAEDVENEITEKIELACQQLGQLKKVTSKSERGRSTVEVEIKDKYDKNALPQVWDELRRKVGDTHLSPGAGHSVVIDDFGDVYGVFFAVTGDGYSIAEIKEYAKFLRRELSQVHGVKKVELYGEEQEVVYVETSREKLAALGISPVAITRALASKNLVSLAGHIEIGTEYIPIDPTGTFASVDDMRNLIISEPGAAQQIYLGDVATIKRGYRDPATCKLRFNGKPAIGIIISTVQGGNVVSMGEALFERLGKLESRRPIGMELNKIIMQPESVTKAVSGFVINLIEAVIIVVVVLLIFMGVRSGLLIGAVLFLTICGTLMVMEFYQITLERISLGALIIALGMLVDNAIVVTDGILVRIQRGEDRIQAASLVVKQNITPLLGATVIAVTAFAAIGLSQDSTGEYCRSLFTVLLISLMFSWITAITITPLFCVMFLKAGKPNANGSGNDPYQGVIYGNYKRFLMLCIRFRAVTVLVTAGLLVASIIGFGFVDKSFFPPSTQPQFMVDFWLPQGTHIDITEEAIEKVAEHIREKYGEEIEGVTTFIGQGGPRFQLTYAPEKPDSAFAQLLISVKDYRTIDKIRRETQRWLDENPEGVPELADAITNVKKFLLGPNEGGRIQLRISGQDADELRRIANEAIAIMEDDTAPDGMPGAVAVHSDWRQRTKVVRPIISEARSRRSGIARPELARALQMAYSGTQVGVFREGDELLPIISRAPENERSDVDNIKDVQVYSPIRRRAIPIRQVLSGFETVWEDSVIWRRNRVRTITIHCDQRTGNASTLLARIKDKIEAIEHGPKYKLEWGGEYEDSRNAQAGLAGSIPAFVVLMVLIVLALFNALRPTAIIWLSVPLAMIGVTFGLLVMRQPFGFMALLGGLALSGMLIKNSIVLLDQINIELSEGKDPFWAVIDSGVSRMRPVAMAAATTILGMLPLLLDAFFIAMAVAIMFGLAFATLLTLIIVPVLYSLFFSIPYQTKRT